MFWRVLPIQGAKVLDTGNYLFHNGFMENNQSGGIRPGEEGRYQKPEMGRGAQLENLGVDIGEATKSVIENTGRKLGDTVTGFEEALDTAKKNVLNTVEDVKADVKSTVEGVKTTVSEAAIEGKRKLTESRDRFTAAVEARRKEVGDFIKNESQKAMDTVDGIRKSTVDFYVSTRDRATGFVEGVIKDVKEGVTTGVEAAAQGARETGLALTEAAVNGGKIVVKGVELSLEVAVGLGYLTYKGGEYVVTKSFEAAQKGLETLKSTATGLYKEATDKVDEIGRETRQRKEMAVDGAKSRISEIKNKYNEKRDSIIGFFTQKREQAQGAIEGAKANLSEQVQMLKNLSTEAKNAIVDDLNNRRDSFFERVGETLSGLGENITKVGESVKALGERVSMHSQRAEALGRTQDDARKNLFG